MKESLKKYRERIDKIDEKIILWLGRRMEIVKKVGILKKEQKIAVRQDDRFARVLDSVIAQGSKKTISRKLITKIYHAIHEEALKLEKSI